MEIAQQYLHLVSSSVSLVGDVIGEARNPNALVLAPAFEPCSESSDAVSVNYGPPEAARPDVAQGAEIRELVACVKELILSNKEVLKTFARRRVILGYVADLASAPLEGPHAAAGAGSAPAMR
jgi:hypothetical protein